MNKEDLTFEIEKDGLVYKCDVTMVIPNSNNEDEPYVVFTTYEMDDKGEFLEYYGKLIGNEEEYSITTDITNEEKRYIDELRGDEIVSYVNTTIEENIDD